jgi:hypothetical protein
VVREEAPAYVRALEVEEQMTGDECFPPLQLVGGRA